MTIQLTEQQHQALTREPESLHRVTDPSTNTTYVLVRVEIFERFQSLFTDDDARLMEPLLADLSPEDWEDLAHYENRP